MSDPRNVAHDKKVKQEKDHDPASAEAKPAKGAAKTDADPDPAPEVAHAPGELEKSTAVLSKLKEMEFHSRANIATLAELTMTIEDELKQKEFSDPIGELYGAQDAFETKIGALIESYAAKIESLKPSA